MAPEETRQSRKVEQALESTPVEVDAMVELLLNHALEAEGNFLALYEAAIRKTQGSERKKKLQEFRGDHERHVQEIRGALEQLGARALVERTEPTPLARAVIEQLEATSSDEELLDQFLASEDLSRHLYGWLGSVPAPEPVAKIAQRGLADEERHYSWVTRELGREEV